MPEGATGVTAGPPARLRVAHVRRVHGVRGEVRVQALGGDAARFSPGTTLLAEGDGQRLTVVSARPLDGDEVLLAFEELPGREQAASLRGQYLCVQTSAARSLGPDEWFVWQLVGLRAVTADGLQLGVVCEVEEQPSSDVIVVRDAAGEHRYPLVREWIHQVDIDRGVIVVTPWPEDES